MDAGHDLTAELQTWLDRMKSGDAQVLDEARAEVVRLAEGRLERLARRMLRRNPRLQRWEQTADVLQNSLVRLHRALETVKPETVQQLFGLAATQIRRELVDLARRHFGPLGGAAHHQTDGRFAGDPNHAPRDFAARGGEPTNLAEWTEFHEKVGRLPPIQREVFDLLWYQGLNQEEAAAVLGVTSRTVKNRWRSAKVLLRDMLDAPPENTE